MLNQFQLLLVISCYYAKGIGMIHALYD